MPEIVPISTPSDLLPVAPTPKASVPTEELELYNFNNSSNSTSAPIPISVSMGDIQIEIGASASDALITNMFKINQSKNLCGKCTAKVLQYRINQQDYLRVLLSAQYPKE